MAIESEGGGYEQSTPDALDRLYGASWSKERKSDSPMPRMAAGDDALMRNIQRTRSGIEQYAGMVRVTGKRDENSNNLGMFSDGELEWHSNQQGDPNHMPVVALLAWEGTAGTCTEFLNAGQAYADLSDEWKETCDQLVCVHAYRPQEIAPGINAVQDQILRYNMCPVDGTRIPLVIKSPGGIRGLHFTYTSISHFDGLPPEESSRIYDYLKDHVRQPKYIHRHNWRDGDLLFMDNTITMHRRPTKDCSKRVLYRMCFNYDRVLPSYASSSTR